MIEVEFHRFEFEGYRPYIMYQWVLSDDEKDALKEALSSFNPHEVEKFVSHLEFYCQDMKSLFLGQPKESEYVQQMAELLDSFKKSFKYLDDIRRGRLWVGAPIKDLDEVRKGREFASKTWRTWKENPTTVKDLAVDCLQTARQTQDHLETIIKAIEANLATVELKQGRRRADHYKFVKTIAEIFNEHLGCRPSSTKEGPFELVVRIACNALNISIEDPTRAIRSALNELNRS